VLHVALYYSCPRLATLCEHRLAQLLRGRERRGAAKQRRGASPHGEHEEDEGGPPPAQPPPACAATCRPRPPQRADEALAPGDCPQAPPGRHPARSPLVGAPPRPPPARPAGLADAAAALLALADEAGLPHLRAVALDYVVHNFGAVAATGACWGCRARQRHARPMPHAQPANWWRVAALRCLEARRRLAPQPHLPPCLPPLPPESYAALSREQVALVAEEACAAHARLVQHIRRLAEQQPLPDPSY
jgi:hypothetical protein